jgi:hypothetical protein
MTLIRVVGGGGGDGGGGGVVGGGIAGAAVGEGAGLQQAPGAGAGSGAGSGAAGQPDAASERARQVFAHQYERWIMALGVRARIPLAAAMAAAVNLEEQRRLLAGGL